MFEGSEVEGVAKHTAVRDERGEDDEAVAVQGEDGEFNEVPRGEAMCRVRMGVG